AAVGAGPGGDGEAARRVWRRDLARRPPRYGYRRAWALLRREGWAINRKRVHRLWQELGLSLPRPRRRRRRRGGGRDPVPVRAERPNHVWTYVFLKDHAPTARRCAS